MHHVPTSSARGVEYSTLARTGKQYRDISCNSAPGSYQNSITGTVLIGGESSIVNKMVLLNTITLREFWHMEERIFHTL